MSKRGLERQAGCSLLSIMSGRIASEDRVTNNDYSSCFNSTSPVSGKARRYLSCVHKRNARDREKSDKAIIKHSIRKSINYSFNKLLIGRSQDVRWVINKGTPGLYTWTIYARLHRADLITYYGKNAIYDFINSKVCVCWGHGEIGSSLFWGHCVSPH